VKNMSAIAPASRRAKTVAPELAIISARAMSNE